jgi:DNA-binding MarR family transcriptional regulator
MQPSSSTKLKIDNLDPVIHERARLGIMSMLAAADPLSFTELKNQLELTDGNLSVHLRILEEAGYVAVEKDFIDRKPRTSVAITKKGRAAFKAYVDVLEGIVRKAKK